MALMISLAAAFFADYLDPSFRTPDEVVQFLDIPLLACFARNGRPPRYGLLTEGAAERQNNSFLPKPIPLGLGRFFGFRGKEQ